MQKRWPWAHSAEKAANGLFFVCACIVIAAAALICIFLLSGAAPALRQIGLVQFLTGLQWRPGGGLYGIWPMIAGSLLVTAGALMLALPVGVLTAVFLACFCPRPLLQVFRPALDLMAGIPSVVYGLFGLAVIVPLIRDTLGGRGFSLLAACLLLGIMILPTVCTVSETAIGAVPRGQYEGALALGATPEQSALRVVLPAARCGIFAGVVLAAGRAMGEAMAVVMVAGNQPLVPRRLTDGVRTLTANIVMEMGYAADLHRGALIASAAVLFVLELAVNLGLSLMRRRLGR